MVKTVISVWGLVEVDIYDHPFHLLTAWFSIQYLNAKIDLRAAPANHVAWIVDMPHPMNIPRDFPFPSFKRTG